MKLFYSNESIKDFSDGELIASANYWQSLVDGPDNKKGAKSDLWINNVVSVIAELKIRKYEIESFGSGHFVFKHKEDDIDF